MSTGILACSETSEGAFELLTKGREVSKALGTDSIPSSTCVIVGFKRTRPEATRRTVCSKWACVLMSGNT